MCRNNCKWKCALFFGLGLIVASFCEGGFTLFLVGIAIIILSFALRVK